MNVSYASPMVHGNSSSQLVNGKDDVSFSWVNFSFLASGLYNLVMPAFLWQTKLPSSEEGILYDIAQCSFPSCTILLYILYISRVLHEKKETTQQITKLSQSCTLKSLHKQSNTINSYYWEPQQSLQIISQDVTTIWKHSIQPSLLLFSAVYLNGPGNPHTQILAANTPQKGGENSHQNKKKHQNILRWFLPYQKRCVCVFKVFSGPDFFPSPTYVLLVKFLKVKFPRNRGGNSGFTVEFTEGEDLGRPS